MGTPLRVLGMMSGTSLDGVDAAVIETDGVAVGGLGPSAYRPYSAAERAVLRAALGQWPGGPGVAAAEAVVEAAHAELAARMGPVDLVGFHGQTLAHDPAAARTHQAGSGARLAQALGRPVAWDFRTADMAAGGQGAPLAPLYHAALAAKMGARAPLAFLNLGGVGNLTFIDPRADVSTQGALLAFDTGPANAPLDDLMRARRGQARDEGGALARAGTPCPALLAAVRAHPFFAAAPPKSLDRNSFEALLAPNLAPLGDADAAASLTALAGACVGWGLALCPARPTRLLVGGGGRLNAALMEAIATHAGITPEPAEAAGLDGDMIEAQAFAYLAARVARGLPLSLPGTTGVPAPCPGGRIAQPG